MDAEKPREADRLPICFDWLIWQALHASLVKPLHIGNPPKFISVRPRLAGDDSFPAREPRSMYARSAPSANLYRDAGKPVVPLNLAITAPDTGARRLFTLGLSSAHAHRLFQATGHGSHTWINRINFTARKSVPERVSAVVDLLEDLERPRAFAVRLLDEKHEDYADVQNFFDIVVQPIMEGELGYKLTVVDGRQVYRESRIDQEIFAKLHRSRVVLADITGMRPNCFLELGYALGRGLPTMLMAKEGSSHPFDIHTLAGLHWKTSGSVDGRRRAFREHWAAIQSRPPLVPNEPLIS